MWGAATAGTNIIWPDLKSFVALEPSVVMPVAVTSRPTPRTLPQATAAAASVDQEKVSISHSSRGINFSIPCCK